VILIVPATSAAVHSAPYLNLFTFGHGRLISTLTYSSIMVSQTVLSAQEVSKHNTANDCWIVVGEKVWDFTQFASAHPGGENGMQFFTNSNVTKLR
jgi:cytochrome b involved in lipid metabolism